jgi:predicted nucleic acid-binding protein
MAYLVDTSVLARLANTAYIFHAIAAHAVLELHRRGEVLHITPQNLVEFRNLATRPKSVNGLGLPPADAQATALVLEQSFPLLSESPDIYPAWKSLVSTVIVIGKQVHDARLVAVCHVHAVSHLLTFNVGHFIRMASFGPGIVVVDPATV